MAEAGLLILQVFVYLMLIGLVTSAVYGNVLVSRLRHGIALHKRGLVGHFGLNIALICDIIFTALNMASNVSMPPSSARSLLYLLSIFGSACSGLAWLCFCLTKAWLIYYRERWSYHTFRNEWYTIINDDSTARTTNWYIRNNRKYGSRAYVTKFFIIFHCAILAIIVFGAVASHFGWLHPAVDTVLIVGPMFVSIVLYLCVICKTTRFKLIDDPFLIHWEAKWHSRLQIGLIVVVLLVSPVTTLSPAIGWMMITLLPGCVMYAIVHVSTYSIYNRLRGLHDDAEHSTTQGSSIERVNSVPSLYDRPGSNSSSPRERPRIKVKVKSVLANKQALHCFMQHLFKEYSPECVLSVIEIQQYQDYLAPQMQAGSVEPPSENAYKLSSVVALPANIPLSSIVENVDTDWRMKAYALWDKYVRVDSEYEVNIAWDTRTEFVPIMGNNAQLLMANNSVKMRDLFDLYDKVKVDMMKLLGYSLTRFKFKEDYDKMVKILEAEKKPSTNLTKTESHEPEEAVSVVSINI